MSDIAIVGNINADVIARSVVDVPAPGTERVVDSIELRVGGAAANCALCLAALGVTSELVGSVGDDAVGRLLLDELVRGGVQVRSVTVSPGATGISIAAEAEHRDRSFLIALGSMQDFFRRSIPDHALSARRVLVCGYFLLPALRGELRALLGEVKARGGETLLDTGWDPGGWSAEARDEVLGLLPWVDVFLPNEAEAAAVTGEREVLDAARFLQATSGGWCVVKRGRHGALASGPEALEFRVEAPTVEALDTTGAGDAFNAGILRGRAEGWTWAKTVSFATTLASSVVSRPSRHRYPGRGELDRAPKQRP
jgi:sugar/nucleoside kinase (ribokinase family)